MIANMILPQRISVLKCGTDITMTGGSSTTRTINLSSVWDYRNLTVSQIYVIPTCWTYVSLGTSVSGITYTYTASTGVLVMTMSAAILNSDWSLDAQTWKVIVTR